jgi:hypothetical protein
MVVRFKGDEQRFVEKEVVVLEQKKISFSMNIVVPLNQINHASKP